MRCFLLPTKWRSLTTTAPVGGRPGRKGNLRKVIDGPNRNTAPMKRLLASMPPHRPERRSVVDESSPASTSAADRLDVRFSVVATSERQERHSRSTRPQNTQ